MSGERLELVTDFGGLKRGDHVLVLTCDHCGRSHEGALVRFAANAPGQNVGNDGITFDDAWVSDGVCDGLSIGINRTLVAVKRCYRVVEQATADTTTEAVRPPETVR